MVRREKIISGKHGNFTIKLTDLIYRNHTEYKLNHDHVIRVIGCKETYSEMINFEF